MYSLHGLTWVGNFETAKMFISDWNGITQDLEDDMVYVLRQSRAKE